MEGAFDVSRAMTTHEFAQQVGVSQQAISNWVAQGKLQPRRFGRACAFSLRDLQKAKRLRDEGRQFRSDLDRADGDDAITSYCTVDEAATVLECSTRTIRRYVADGRLHAFRTELGPLSLLRAEVEGLAAQARSGAMAGRKSAA